MLDIRKSKLDWLGVGINLGKEIEIQTHRVAGHQLRISVCFFEELLCFGATIDTIKDSFPECGSSLTEEIIDLAEHVSRKSGKSVGVRSALKNNENLNIKSRNKL